MLAGRIAVVAAVLVDRIAVAGSSGAQREAVFGRLLIQLAQPNLEGFGPRADWELSFIPLHWSTARANKNYARVG